jgi:hypothetical protein
MAALRPVPLFGSGVYGKSAVVTRQRRLNCYYENRPDGDKSKIVIYGSPGLVLAMTVGSNANQPMRGLFGTNSTLFGVIENQFQVLVPPTAPGGEATAAFSSPIGTSQGLVSLATNPAQSQTVVVDGSNGYVYTAGALSLLPSGSWFVPGALTVTNVGGYFVTEIPGTAQFGVSNINDATNGNALSFASAAAYPDIMAAVDNLSGNLITFAQQHLEFWQPVPSTPPNQPFYPIQSAACRIGLAAVFSRAQFSGGAGGIDSLLFLGTTVQGKRHVYMIQGYSVLPVSDEIDAVINTAGFTYSDAVALSYGADKHGFYQLTFPTMGRTFVLDLSTMVWAEAQTGLTSAYAARHQGNLSVNYAGATLISDWASSSLYSMSDTAYTDNGATILREIVTRHTVKGFNRFRVPRIYLDMETGVGIAGMAGVQGVQPKISIEVSKDNGRTWFPPRILPLGALGQYMTRVVARRFGQSRVFTFRIRMTDPVKFVITDAAMTVKGKQSLAA